MSDHIPPGIVLNILTRLPAKSLLRFRCVCKSWLAVIDIPNFAKLHLFCSISNKSNTYILTSEDKVRFYTLDGVLVKNNNTRVRFENLSRTDGGFDREFYNGNYLGSVNGILCVSLYDVACERNGNVFTTPDGPDLLLMNHATKKGYKLPPVSTDREPGFVGAYPLPSFGFGYDSVNDDFKVVRVEQAWNIDANDHSYAVLFYDVKVFSLKKMCWTKKQDFPHPLRDDTQTAKFAFGCLHWTVTPATHPFQQPHYQGDMILSFDLATEKYRVFPQPKYPKRILRTSLEAFEGYLAMVVDYNLSYFDIWVMKEFGVKDSWTRLISVDKCEYVRPVAYSQDGGQVLLEKNWKQLVWYNLESKNCKDSAIQGTPKFNQGSLLYVESLVKLPGPGKFHLKLEKRTKKKNSEKSDGSSSKGSK